MKKNKILIAPSILSADFSRLESEIKTAEKAKADMLHVDVMDGHFVPNISIGPAVVAAIRKRTNLPLDVHLMISDPEFFLEPFIRAGSNIITVHIETCSKGLLKKIKRRLSQSRVRFGISLNPATPLKKVIPVLDLADMILLMSVHPGFGGQSFIKTVLPKIKDLRALYDKDIEVDGGITDKTAPRVIKSGANILVAGSYVFGKKNRTKAIEKLRCGL
ncbi:MAG: ribulose-phosphate 3-epimerase [Candidatus Omnitrophica bacterium]|nr:ribulose-phosphate 3-epimerase [Candidatus Omnitrophota bacterium]